MTSMEVTADINYSYIFMNGPFLAIFLLLNAVFFFTVLSFCPKLALSVSIMYYVHKIFSEMELFNHLPIVCIIYQFTLCEFSVVL